MSSSEDRNAQSGFAARVIAWQKRYGRHDLPWQGSADPYAVWVSEIMLQQTQVETVIPYYRRFLARFPDIGTLAAADEDAVLALWSGLGYYSRARNLYRAATRISDSFGGTFPRRFEDIVALPGIGRSTAGAIAVFAYGERKGILDGNVKRVFSRCFGITGWPGEKAVEERLWALAEALLPHEGLAAYTQGLMDLGATVCRRNKPRCGLCPVAEECVANQEGRQAELPASRPRKTLPERQTRMLILRHAGEILLEKRPASGIWGGLWSLPECAPGDDVAARAQGLGCDAEVLEPLPEMLHGFTHFRLRIRPQPMLVTKRPVAADEPGRIWLNLEEAKTAALPTPVRKILEQLEAE